MILISTCLEIPPIFYVFFMQAVCGIVFCACKYSKQLFGISPIGRTFEGF